jgi:hypothetical protein
MKVLGAGHYIVPELEITAGRLIRYALSCGITLAFMGCLNFGRGPCHPA